MRYHAKKSLVLLITTVLITGVMAYFMITNYPSDGVLLKDVAPYYSKYIIMLIVGIVINRLIISGLFRLIYTKQKEQEPWKKEDKDILVEYSAIVNVFMIAAIGLVIALALQWFNQPLTWFFILLFIIIFGIELTYLASIFVYHRKED